MGSLRGWAALGVVVLAVAVLLGLGSWQILRMREMSETADRFDRRIAEPPLAWPPADAAATDADTDAIADTYRFRRVTVSGTWDFPRSQFVTARIRYGLLGEEIVTPLRPDDGGPALLINRGWYPLEERGAVLADLATVERGEVEALLQEAPTGAVARTPDGAWRWFHARAMAAEIPYPVAPYRFLAGRLATDAEATTVLSRTLPVQLYDGYRSDTPHLEYALTWFGLAAALVATAIIRVRAEHRRPAPTVRQRDASRAL